mmetsp:Transcript_28827/g.67107  ORF Transcript_28827/g.67107 Transcript_28827/m.67107 type:complete len:1326 (-) Transcript_28827:154-4131(-)
MTTLVKLGIQGIRSFDHERLEVLDFQKPVTLIVGPNGSGKTTIIECLKMASSGVLPPNSKNGHGFVHDPQVAHLPEVKAQIRMLFRTGGRPRDKEICAIRSFQLTNKRVGGRVRPSFKALESVLRTMADDGTKTSISHKCVDMDTEVPDLMGVSKAVLEHVIFCHQEESSWPLQDAATVKRCFDAIFGASRYTTALKNIRDLQRDWNKITRDRRADADLSQAHLDQATKLKGQRDERQQNMEGLGKAVADLARKATDAEEATQKAEMELAEFQSRGIRVQELRGIIGRLQEDRSRVMRTMGERGQDIYTEPLEELQRQSRQFEEQMLAQSEQRVKQAKAALAKGEVDFHQAVDTARRVRDELGEAAGASELLSSRKAELADRLKRVDQPTVAALKARLDVMAGEFARLQNEQRQRDKATEEALAAAERTQKEAALELSKNESRMEDAAASVRRLEEEAKTLVRAVPDLDSHVRIMRENEAALSAEGSDERLRRLDARQEEIARRRHEITYSISRKSSEVVQLEAQSDAHVEVDAARRRLREAEEEIGQKLSQARPHLMALLGQMPDTAEVETKVEAELKVSQGKLSRHRQTLQEVQHRQGAIAAKLSVAEGDLARLQHEETSLTKELGAPSMSIGGGQPASACANDFNLKLSNQREQVELARKDLSMTESAQHMYEKFREKSRSKNACQFCRRAFAGDGDLATFEESVERLIVKIPSFLEESSKRLNGAQDELQRLEKQRPKWERLVQLRDADIPNKLKEISRMAEEDRVAQASVEPELRELKRLEDRVQQLQDARADASTLQRLARSFEELKSSVRAKEARVLGANSKVSLQAERDQLRTLQEQLSELGREEDAVRTQRELLAKQQEQLRTQIAEQKGRLQLLQAQVARRGDVDRELAARQADLRDFTEAAKRARLTQDTANSKVQELREERTQAANKFRRDLDVRDGEVRNLQREVDALTEIEKAIEVMRNRVENAEVIKAKLVSADDAVRNAERELEGLKARLESEEEKQRKREEVRQCLEANLRLKTLEMDIKKQESEVDELIRELGGKDLEAMRRELDGHRHRHLDMQKQLAFREGELNQTKEAVRALEAELNSPLYAGAEQRHREAVVKHESAAYAAKDLGRYHSALDKALMKYHTMKLNQTNKVVKELWQKVYRGRDIDYIAIRSDTEEAENSDGGGAAAAESVRTTTRSYNYRVVMVCGDVEMDMRGRCSAGQRVLASLIIRLALADSFCVNCGVLALDEPTTNLDTANIKSLAEAFAGLIEARRNQAHFQLVLITHDEVFVDHLCQLQVADWYYHIHKDEHGCSRMERRDFRRYGA